MYGRKKKEKKNLNAAAVRPHGEKKIRLRSHPNLFSDEEGELELT